MSKGLKWTIIGVIIVAVLGGIAFFGYEFFKYKQDVKVPEVKKSAEQIVEENKSEINKVDKSEKEVFLNILDTWKHKDFSNGVQAHNYAWKRLNGQIGRAKELREQYKTKK